MATTLITIQTLTERLKESLHQANFVKASLGDYRGSERDLKQIHVKEVRIRGQVKLSYTYRYKSKDVVKNYERIEGIAKILSFLENDFHSLNLFTLQEHLIFSKRNDGKWILKVEEAIIKEKPPLTHDHQKNRVIAANSGKQYLQELNIIDQHGRVYKNAQDKYKQINHYIELLRPLIDDVGSDNIQEVVDMGSGKGYLTFALYDYLSQFRAYPLRITGVEFRSELVAFCNKVARSSNFSGLTFKEGAIVDYESSNMDMLVALHACDTATDDAIFKGIKAKAKLIVVAPCCHKQIRKEMGKAKINHVLQPLTRSGIFLERQAEMLTDTIRALLLEYYGYKTKVFEFISDNHTPKNVMISAVKTVIRTEQKEHIKQQIIQLKAFFGIDYHYLEKLLGY